MALEDHSRLMQAYVEKAMVDLPSLPTVIIHVVKATEKETVSTSEIEDLIGTDAAISTKLLKVVNSAYFGMPRQIFSISQAIAILGLHQVRNLVLSIGVLNALRHDSARTEALQRSFWELSFGTASCASIIARQKRLPTKEQELLFVAGLLHDIGVLFLLTQFTTPYLEVLRVSNANQEQLVDVEQRSLHTNHAWLGGMLANKWNFPDDLAELIARHETADRPDESPASCVLHIADRLVGGLSDGQISGFSPALTTDQVSWLGLDESSLEGLKVEVAEQIEKAKELLGILS
jgi:HD-like signal output (HDOD) protein